MEIAIQLGILLDGQGQMINHIYAYAKNNPMVFTDKTGLTSILGIIKCAYYTKKMNKFKKVCTKECPIDPEGTANFIDKYTKTGSLSVASVGCVCVKAGSKLCDSWKKSCGQALIPGLPPKPR